MGRIDYKIKDIVIVKCVSRWKPYDESCNGYYIRISLDFWSKHKSQNLL